MSKGGTTSGSTEIPAWLESAAIENINKARDVSQIGYVPYYGPDVAAFSPMQQQSMQSTGNAASAFGLAPQGFNAMAGMPQAETFAGGVQGYSSAPLYEQSLDNLFANAPAQYRAMNSMFIDPFTGAAPRGGYGATPMQTSQMSSGGGGGGGGEVPFQFPQDQTSDSEIFGVNRAYNPYKYSMPTEDISGDGVVDYRDMSFGEGGRRDVPMSERIVNGVFGGPLRAADFLQGAMFDMSGVGKSTMTPEQSMQIINDGADRYSRLSADRGFNPNSLGYQYDQRGDMYPPQIQGGLLDNSPYQADGNEQALAQARMQEDIMAAQAAQQAAVAEQQAAQRAAQQAKIDQIKKLTAPVAKSTVNSGPSDRGGSTYSGGGKAARDGYGGISGGGGR